MSIFCFVCEKNSYAAFVIEKKRSKKIAQTAKPNILCMYVMNGFINMQPVYTIKIYSSASSVSMERKMTWKTEKKRSTKWEIIGNDFVWVGRLIAYPLQHFIQLFRHDFEKTDDKKKKNPKPNLHSWHLIFFYIMYIFFVAFVSFANFVWPLHGFDHLSSDEKKYTSFVNNKMIWFAISQPMIFFFQKAKIKERENTRDQIVWNIY